MSALPATIEGDPLLGADVVSHLEAQLVAARRLLQVVLEQGLAIRDRDAHRVVELTGLLQAELQRRGLLEQERIRLLERAGSRLGVTAGAVTLALLGGLLAPETARSTVALSSELRGLLEHVQREHFVNRALMTQELAFLDHLLKLAGSPDDLGYDAAGDRPSGGPGRLSMQRRVLDLEV